MFQPPTVILQNKVNEPMKPLLSICIPTYNRADWLRSSLWNWLPQVKEAGNLVELIVSDNASIDRTKQVVEEAQVWGDFQYHCNVENIGVLKNMYKLVNELAKGEFVWMLGDDDLPRHDAVSRVIKVLQDHRELNYVYVNYSSWHPEKAPKQLLTSSELDFSYIRGTESQDKFVHKLAEVVPYDLTCFTPIYVSVWRQQLAKSAFELGLNGEVYTSVETTYPHAVFIASNLLNQPAWYVGYPCILASTQVSWSYYMPICIIEHLENLYDIIEDAGVSAAVIDVHRREIMGLSTNLIVDILVNKQVTYSKMRLVGLFFKYNFRYRQFWLEALPFIMKRLIYRLSIKIINYLPQPMYRLLRVIYSFRLKIIKN